MQKPETAEMKQLWLEVEVAIASVEPEAQLLVAGETISQIVKIYVKRANAILNGLEVKDTNTGSVLSEDFLSGLMRQSMTIDLEDLMEEDLLPLSRTQATRDEPIGSVVTPVEKETAREIARQAKEKMKQMFAQLAADRKCVKMDRSDRTMVGTTRSREGNFPADTRTSFRDASIRSVVGVAIIRPAICVEAAGRVL